MSEHDASPAEQAPQARSTQVPGGWVVASPSFEAEEGVRWLQLTFLPDPEPDPLAAERERRNGQTWPRDPGLSSTTRRLKRR